MVPQIINRTNQDAIQRTSMSPEGNKPVNTQTTTQSTTQLTLCKKSNAIEVCFKKEKFSGAPTNTLT